MAKKKPLSQEFFKGVVKENPLLVLMLGACPALAVTSTAINGLGMGLSATFVLVMSNLVISLIKGIIPKNVRIPCYITIIASLVTVLQFLLQAFVPSLNDALGIFIPLITVNCIILGRAEAFASKNSTVRSVIDGLGMGLGFATALFLIGSLREILGSGTIFGTPLPLVGENGPLQPMLIFALPPGGFAIFGVLMGISQKLNQKYYGNMPSKAMDRANFPGSISSRTDKVYDREAVGVGVAGSKLQSVPEALKKDEMVPKQKGATETKAGSPVAEPKADPSTAEQKDGVPTVETKPSAPEAKSNIDSQAEDKTTSVPEVKRDVEKKLSAPEAKSDTDSPAVEPVATTEPTNKPDAVKPDPVEQEAEND